MPIVLLSKYKCKSNSTTTNANITKYYKYISILTKYSNSLVSTPLPPAVLDSYTLPSLATGSMNE